MNEFIFLSTHAIMFICALVVIYPVVFKRTKTAGLFYKAARLKKMKQHWSPNLNVNDHLQVSRQDASLTGSKNLIFKLDSLFLKELPHVKH